MYSHKNVIAITSLVRTDGHLLSNASTAESAAIRPSERPNRTANRSSKAGAAGSQGAWAGLPVWAAMADR
eukprot:SAG25_NODE_12916_length_273_cov_1.752874_2_plen_69_part_01